MNDEVRNAAVFKNLDEINFLFIAMVVVVAWLLTRGSERLFPWFAEHVPNRMRLHILRMVPVLRLVILTGAFVQLVPLVIVTSSQNLLAIFGAAGLAIGFAFKEYVSSLIAGVVTIYERPYRPGDWVQVGDAYGEVRSLGLRALTMVTPDDTVVTVPHSTIWEHNLFNSNSGERTLLSVADFYLRPKHDARRVRGKLRDVALTSSYLDLERPVTVTVAEKPWGTHYRLKVYAVDSRLQFQLTSDLTVRGKAALMKLGAEPVVQPLAAGRA